MTHRRRPSKACYQLNTPPYWLRSLVRGCFCYFGSENTCRKMNDVELEYCNRYGIKAFSLAQAGLEFVETVEDWHKLLRDALDRDLFVVALPVKGSKAFDHTNLHLVDKGKFIKAFGAND